MKAVVVHDFNTAGGARIGEIAEPVPAAGEVLVDLYASDVNYPDILYVEGKYQATPQPPFSPGLGGAGSVVALGEGVRGVEVGQRVLVLPNHGTYAERLAAPRAHCFPMPSQMPFDVGAALGLAYQTAYFALVDRGRLREGDNVLVLGASGGVGMAAVQLAKALGARTVIAATRGEEGAVFAKKHGADAIVDAAYPQVHDHLRAVVSAATDGHGADVVIDPVGGPLNAAALRALAWNGTMVVVGFASGEIPKIGANYLLVKNIAASGLQWTDYRTRQPERVAAAQQTIFELWSQGKLTPEIGGCWPLGRFAEALSIVAQGRARGKLILAIRDQTQGIS